MSESPQTPEAFVQHFVEVTQRISGQVIGSDLEEQLNQAFPAGASGSKLPNGCVAQAVKKAGFARAKLAGSSSAAPYRPAIP